MFHNLHLSAPAPIFTLNLSHPCFSIFISQHSRPPSPFSHLSTILTAPHLHLSTFLTSLNYSHSRPSSSLNLSHSPVPLNIFISHLSQPFVKALSTTPLLPQSRSGERTIITLISQSFYPFL